MSAHLHISLLVKDQTSLFTLICHDYLKAVSQYNY